jgi:hypothetical protein
VRVLVCGGRDYTKGPVVRKELSALRPAPTLLIEGGATGADHQAKMWAVAAKVPVRMFAADWRKHGPAAGPIRNQRMLDEGKPDLVIAFPGGRGTADMVRRARSAGIEVREIEG